MASATFTGTQGVAVREDTAIIHCTVSGVTFPGTYSWASAEGGDVSSDSVYTRPGGMQPGVQLGGPVTRSDLTVKRHYTNVLDAYLEALEEACGAARMTVSWTTTDGDGNPNGLTHSVTGVLKEVQWPQIDANSTAAAFLTLVMACDQVASAPGSVL